MTKFYTKSFVNSIDISDSEINTRIDAWLNGLTQNGTCGVEVVGYVSCEHWTIRITARQWVLRSTPLHQIIPSDVSQPESWHEPAIDVSDEDK